MTYTGKKRSLGALKSASDNGNPKAPDATGTLDLQRHTFEELAKQFAETDEDEIRCNLAGWFNGHVKNRFLTVEVSPKYEFRKGKAKPDSRPTSLERFFDEEDSDEE